MLPNNWDGLVSRNAYVYTKFLAPLINAISLDAGLWGGLVPRIVMIGTLTAAQWFIYDAVKVFLRMPRPPPPEMPESLKKKLGVTGEQ